MRKYFTLKAFKTDLNILNDTLNGFIDDKCLKLSASLSYYTLFSLAPLILLLISLAGFFLGRDAIQGQLFSKINGIFGNTVAVQIQEMVINMELSGKTTTAVVIGIITLLIGATSVFAEIQDSINMIWRVKIKPKRGWLKILTNRLLSLWLIGGLGFLLIVSLVINIALLAMNNLLKDYFPNVTIVIFNILNIVISFGLITVLFGIIFKVLPDVKIAWKDVQIGAFFTACLFMAGRFLIGLYIDTVITASAYGAAGSLIIILVWIYYSAVIVYFGVEFTRVYANYVGRKIEPAEFAVYVEQIEREIDKAIVPPLEKKEIIK